MIHLLVLNLSLYRTAEVFIPAKEWFMDGSVAQLPNHHFVLELQEIYPCSLFCIKTSTQCSKKVLLLMHYALAFPYWQHPNSTHIKLDCIWSHIKALVALMENSLHLRLLIKHISLSYCYNPMTAVALQKLCYKRIEYERPDHRNSISGQPTNTEHWQTFVR